MTEDEIPPRCCVCGVDVLPTAVVLERQGNLPAVYMCHHCRRDPNNAVPGGQTALDADRVEAAALADLIALRDQLECGG
jgi:hypothetical protein